MTKTVIFSKNGDFSQNGDFWLKSLSKSRGFLQNWQFLTPRTHPDTTVGQKRQSWPKSLSNPRGKCQNCQFLMKKGVKKWHFWDVRFFGDIFEKNGNFSVFSGFSIKFTENHWIPRENLIPLEMTKTSENQRCPEKCLKSSFSAKTSKMAFLHFTMRFR